MLQTGYYQHCIVQLNTAGEVLAATRKTNNYQTVSWLQMLPCSLSTPHSTVVKCLQVALKTWIRLTTDADRNSFCQFWP